MTPSKNKVVLIIIVLLLIAAGAYLWRNHSKQASRLAGSDPKNGTYEIQGHKITLVDGAAQTETAPGSAAKTVTVYFGNEAKGDINNDDVDDIVFVLTQNTGGSGTFYYAAALLSGKDGYHGTSAILLGDRVAPQTTEIRDGEAIVNYADRAVDQAMTDIPSLNISKRLKVENGNLAVDF